MKVHHIGYLVKNIYKTIPILENLGYNSDSKITYDPSRKANIVFMKNGFTTVELVCPDNTSDIYPLLKKYVNTPYHICYEVDNLDYTISSLTQKGWLLFKDKQKAPAISPTAEVVFLAHASAGMIELIVNKNGELL